MTSESLDAAQVAARAQFDRQSERYGRSHILHDVTDVERALAHVPGPAPDGGDRALDVATGAGHTGLLLAARGFATTLADLAPGMLAEAGRAAAERGLTVDLAEHAAETLPYENGRFALVSCRVAGHHFSRPGRFVAEAARVLRPGGHLLLIDGTVPDGEPEAAEWIHQVEKWRDPSHGRFLSPGEWRSLLAEAGLHSVHERVEAMKQPDLEWYFTTANTPDPNRHEVRRLLLEVPPAAQRVFQPGEQDGRVIWWWQRLTLVAVKQGGDTGIGTGGPEQETRS